MERGKPSTGPLRIALLSPPMLPVPPVKYAGTERIVATLATALHRRGHAVTVFAPGDSQVESELVATTPRSLWSTGYRGDIASYLSVTLAKAWALHHRFDVIHSHIETQGFLFARHCPTPVVSTLHGRLDDLGYPELIAEFSDVPLVAISDSQRRWFPDANWAATIHHGLPLENAPFASRPGDYLAFVGRVAPEKGVDDAIELARSTGLTLRMGAKVYDTIEQELYARVVAPAVAEGVVEYLGELGPMERDALLAGALATVMLGAWPEPFGLVAIESMATGTPVIARRAGALPEIVEHNRTGFLVDDLPEARLAVNRAAALDRSVVRQLALTRFSADRMVDEYEAVYRRIMKARTTTTVVIPPRRTVPVMAPSGSSATIPIETNGHSVAEDRERAPSGSYPPAAKGV